MKEKLLLVCSKIDLTNKYYREKSKPKYNKQEKLKLKCYSKIFNGNKKQFDLNDFASEQLKHKQYKRKTKTNCN